MAQRKKSVVAVSSNEGEESVLLPRARLLEDLHSSDCVGYGLECLWESVSNAITKTWLKTIDVPIAVDITMLKMMKVVAWSVAAHDGNIDRKKQLEQRDPEGEPCRALMDPWARGTVPTKKEVIDPFMNLSGTNSGPPSIASRQPSRAPSEAGSYQSGKSRTLGSVSTNKGGAPGRSKKDDNVPGTIIELDEEVFDFDATGGMFQQLQKIQRQKLKELKLRQSKAGVDEFAVLKEEIATAQKNIKAKNKGKNVKFVIDKEGKLITVDPVRPEGLPPFAMPINPNISPEGNDENNDGKRRGKGRKSIRVPGAVSVPLEDLYFKAANTLATTLAGGEQIKEIQPGVSIQAGENVRMGPESLALPNKQTRKEYLRGSTNQMGSYIDGLGSSLDSPGSASPGAVQFALDANETLHGGSSMDRRGSSPVSQMSALGAATMRLPDIDIFEGCRKIAPTDASTTGQDNNNNNNSASFESDEEINEIFEGGKGGDELSLVANRIPTKPSDVVRANMSLLHGGPQIAGNRDRDIPLSMLSPAERTKLPAPAYGHTTGHGLASPTDRSTPGVHNSASFSPGTSHSAHSNNSGTRKKSEDSRGLGGVIMKERPDIARHMLR